MNLRTKTALYVGLPIVLLVGLLGAVLGGQSRRETAELERADLSRHLLRAAAAVESELSQLETLTLDWAVWDAAHDYVRGRNPEFEQRSLNPTALRAIELYGVVFHNTGGGVLAARRSEGEFSSTLEGVEALVQPRRWRMTRQRQFIVSSGLVVLAGQRFLVAQAPVIPSSYLAPPQGRLTFVRRLDEARLSEVSRLVQLRVELPEMLPEAVQGVLAQGRREAVLEHSDRLISGYRVLSPPGEPETVVVHVQVSRELWQQARQQDLRGLLGLAGAGLLLFALTLILLERGLLARLGRMRRELHAIGEQADPTLRVTAVGRDELEHLAERINHSLSRIESMRIQQVRLELDLEKLRGARLEAEVARSLGSVEALRLELLERLALVAEYRDDDTGQHNQRVGRISAELALELGMPPEEVERLRYAARLHDLGKIALPDDILLKPGKLDPFERELMQTHTLQGARMLENSPSVLLEMARVVALTHHEAWDGSGYPHGLAGEAIPLVGRIVAVADTYDALLSVRVYKPAWTLEATLAEIQRLSGQRFDPAVVTALERVLAAGRARPEVGGALEVGR